MDVCRACLTPSLWRNKISFVFWRLRKMLRSSSSNSKSHQEQKMKVDMLWKVFVVRIVKMMIDFEELQKYRNRYFYEYHIKWSSNFFSIILSSYRWTLKLVTKFLSTSRQFKYFLQTWKFHIKFSEFSVRVNDSPHSRIFLYVRMITMMIASTSFHPSSSFDPFHLHPLNFQPFKWSKIKCLVSLK